MYKIIVTIATLFAYSGMFSQTWNTGTGAWISPLSKNIGIQKSLQVGDNLGTDSLWCKTDLNYFEGNVGIGTTTPEAKLHVSSSDTTGIEIAHLENNSAAATMALHSHADSSAIYLAQSGNYQASIGIEGLTKDFRIYGGLTQLAIAIDTSNAYTFYDSIGEPAMSIHPEGDVVAHKGLSVSNGTTSQGNLYFVEDLDNGTNTVVLKTPASLAASYGITLPADDGSGGQVLTTNGSGVTSWSNKESIWDSLSGIVIQWQSDSLDALTIVRTSDGFYAIAPSDSTLGLALSTQNQNARIRLEEAGGDGAIYLETGAGENVTINSSQKLFAVTINDSARFWIDSTGKVIVVGTTDSYALPTNDGNANEVLTTNGSGVTSWTALQDTTWEFITNNDMYFASASGQFHIYDLGSNEYAITITPSGTSLIFHTSSIIEVAASLHTRHVSPVDSNVYSIGTGDFRYSDSYINSMTTYSIIDEGSTVNTTAGDTLTINAISGRFRKDATGTAFTLANSYISTASIILLTPANAAIDATATTWTVAAASGSATITFNAAPTANFDMNFLVIN